MSINPCNKLTDRNFNNNHLDLAEINPEDRSNILSSFQEGDSKQITDYQSDSMGMNPYDVDPFFVMGSIDSIPSILLERFFAHDLKDVNFSFMKAQHDPNMIKKRKVDKTKCLGAIQDGTICVTIQQLRHLLDNTYLALSQEPATRSYFKQMVGSKNGKAFVEIKHLCVLLENQFARNDTCLRIKKELVKILQENGESFSFSEESYITIPAIAKLITHLESPDSEIVNYFNEEFLPVLFAKKLTSININCLDLKSVENLNYLIANQGEVMRRQSDHYRERVQKRLNALEELNTLSILAELDQDPNSQKDKSENADSTAPVGNVPQSVFPATIQNKRSLSRDDILKLLPEDFNNHFAKSLEQMQKRNK